MCCTGIEENENITCSNNKLKRPEVIGIEFRNPINKTSDQGTRSEVKKQNYAKTASSLPKPVRVKTASSSYSHARVRSTTFYALPFSWKILCVLKLPL